ncbi:D-ribose pyranase [Lacticaseibacillus rhamnosus]|uniref:D-ribose pyranase n=1 Tax=Lacticaseibacillus rhamnosus TaxID=47715 RepID=UPI0007DE554D|nr:D-ribose pyranase [Lacticaseibacillus rhamnosus]OFP98648.1 D-ribose pyranase [Lactobacillus sp. HMSC075D02]MCT3192387.1 D-ribose pyranase [Lacticaseibacillus rhamnosus]MCT3372326.1 D-ribose pyranase [Lacticaseibacillus rhamnosus]OAU12753.1 ribose pyranase [Lacticaseibacillus rhamnosus]OAU22268.1 ribose pyranase [Lacticaseibacillus rhamnosus]
MKKGTVINTQLSQVIADMGHFDLLGIGDAGMPVPTDTWKIDLAVSRNLPSFMDVLKNVLTELQIQKVYLAEEIKTQNPKQLEQIQQLIDVPIVFIPHDQMKKDLSKTKAFIRTGEMTPYANILLESGVTF